MKKTVFILFLALAIHAHGQEHSLGIQGGLNLTGLRDSDYYDLRKGFIGGFAYEMKFMNNFSIGLDVLYNQRGYVESFADENEGFTVYRKFHYDYLSLPLKFGYSFGNKFFVAPNIGFIPSFLLKSELIFPVYTPDGNMPESDEYLREFSSGYDSEEWYFAGYKTVDMKKYVDPEYDFAWLIELEAGYELSDHLVLFSLFSYNFSFTWHSNEYFGPGRTKKHYGFSFSLGLSYKLNLIK